jgi:uncharacterized membrane protein YhaH (DUF805 family)
MPTIDPISSSAGKPLTIAPREFVVTQRLQVYERPSSRAAAVKHPKGTRLTVLGEATDELGYRWWRVACGDGRGGFIFDTTEGYFANALDGAPSHRRPSRRILAVRKWFARMLLVVAAPLGVTYLFVPLAFDTYASRVRDEVFWPCVSCAVVAVFAAMWLQDDSTSEISLNGRIGRMTYWLWMLPMQAIGLWLAYVAAHPAPDAYAYPNESTGGVSFLFAMFAGLLTAFAIPVQVKRWHDLEYSGWTQLINLVPILGWAVSFVMLGFVRGTRGPNRFGSDPLLPHQTLRNDQEKETTSLLGER